MNPLTCCRTAARAAQKDTKTADGQAHPPSGKQRGFALAKFSLPTLILTLLPKCPACFAVYISMGTGISLSVQARLSLPIYTGRDMRRRAGLDHRKFLPLGADEQTASLTKSSLHERDCGASQ
jgi:hypothetical protein